MLDVAEFGERHLLPLPGVLKFGEAEAGLGFAFAGEKLLHQPFFMGLERVHFLRLRGHQLVHRTQALGDFLLFGGTWKNDWEREKCFSMDTSRLSTSV